MIQEEKDKKFNDLLLNGYSKKEIVEIAEPWAREHSHNPEEEQALFDGFMAGFEEGWGLGLQDAADIYCED